MGYISELIQTQRQYASQQLDNEQFIGLPTGAAYSQYFPTWEVTSPQYITPTAYTLAQLGYRTNEVAYICIDLWMKTISEAPVKVYDKKSGEEVDDHPFTEFMQTPCPDLSQSDFWNAVIMYLKITGFMGWEKDFSNGGDLISLWPMMPQYCSFKRGERQLLGGIHYQPYTGLPALDIPRERIVFFAYADPLFYGLKPFSPTMVLMDIIGVDNDMTNMIRKFLKNGAFVSGLLKTEQIINEVDAKFARERWHESHGGPQNAGQIAVLGKGLEFMPASNTFREMVFPEVDARNEVRICMAYGVKPILISAKAGLDRSTFSNYEEARKAWYEENVTTEWRFLEDRITRDLLRHFDDDPNHIVRFDISSIKALQEDRDAAWKRSDEAFKARVVTRDEARKEKGLDPMPDKVLGEELYMTVMEQTSLAMEDNLDTANVETKEEVNIKGPGTVKVTEKEKEEEKAFRRFAAKRIKENKPHMIGEFEFKYVSEERQRQLLSEFGVPDADALAVIEAIRQEIISRKSSNYSPNQIFINNPPTDLKLYANMPELKQPEISVTSSPVYVEVKPADSNPVIEVNPTFSPVIEVNPEIEVTTPKISHTVQKVKRDENLNLDGTVTEYIYKKDEE